MLPLLVLLGTIAGAWYLLIVRPQKDLQTRHGRLVERLQVGDHVLTVGGIYGRVAAIEGASVVLELAPGLETRIATDGIARIVHGGEAALPTAMTDGVGMVDAASTPRQALDTDMHQHPHSDQQQPQQAFAAPQYVAPQQPYAAPAPIAPQQHAAPQHAAPQHAVAQHQVAQTIQMPAQPQHVMPQQYAAAPVQLPAPPPPMLTMRAPVGSTIPTYEPRPWGDVAPVNAQPQQHAQPVQQHHAPVQQHVAPQQYAPVQHAPVQHAPIAPQPMPLHQPFAPQAPQYAAPQYAAPQYAAPQHAAPQQHAPQGYAAQPIVQQPVVQQPVVQQPVVQQPMSMAHHVTHAPANVAPVAEPAEQERARRHSRAPQGMGSSLRLDDPSISDTMTRARSERAGLADEYRKLTAPLVAVEEQQHAHAHAVAQGQQPQLVGHDPNGMPLFATPGAPPTHATAQYPAPAHPQPAHAMPRPIVAAPHQHADPALTSNAFQRATPYTPDPALQRAQQPAAAHALEPAHA